MNSKQHERHVDIHHVVPIGSAKLRCIQYNLTGSQNLNVRWTHSTIESDAPFNDCILCLIFPKV